MPEDAPPRRQRRRRRRRLPPADPIPLGYQPPPTVFGLRPRQWLQAVGLTGGLLVVAGGVLAAMMSLAA